MFFSKSIIHESSKPGNHYGRPVLLLLGLNATAPLFFKVEVRSLWEHRQMFSNKVRKIGNLGAAVSAFAVLIILDAAKRARKHT